jgi:hypothetical protein
MSIIKKPSINVRGQQVTASGILDASGGTGAFSLSAGPNGISGSLNFNAIQQRAINRSRARGPLAKLYQPNGGKTYQPIIYPLDLDDEHYMIYNVVDRRRPSQKNEGTTRILRSIILPIPANLGVEYSAGYSNESLGALGAMAQGSMGGAELGAAGSDLSSFISEKVAAAKNAFKTDKSDAQVKSGTVVAGVAAVVGATAGAGLLGGALAAGGIENIGTGLMQNEGIAINPHMAVVFQGVDFRTHSFQYKFIAKNQEESDRLKELINVMKENMLPEYKFGTERAGFAFKYPNEFTIEFSSKLSPYLFDIGTSVMTGLSVNYNGEGIPTFFETTGAPVSIDITMSFQETRILTRNGFDKTEYTTDQTPPTNVSGNYDLSKD